MLNRMDIRFIALAVAGSIAVGAAALADTTDTTDTAGLACEIVTGHANGMVSIEPVVYGHPAATGRYSFRVAASGHGGRSNITQGGDFSIPPGGAMSLGRVALGAGGSYDARLTIDAGHATITCDERI